MAKLLEGWTLTYAKPACALLVLSLGGLHAWLFFVGVEVATMNIQCFAGLDYQRQSGVSPGYDCEH